MLTVSVFRDCIEGRLARLLWSYGKFTNVSLTLSETCGPAVFREDDQVTMKLWPDIIFAAVKDSPAEEALIPPTEAMRNTLYSWLDYAAERHFSIMSKDCLEPLNRYLLNRTFLVSNNVTMADLVIYLSTHSWMLKSEAEEKLRFPNIVRWFDHMQHLPGIVNTFKDIPLVNIEKDMDLITTIMGNGSVKPVYTNGVSGAAHDTNHKDRNAKLAAKAKSKEAKDAKNVDADRPVNDVSRLNIKVGQIKAVERHPEADRLYCLKIDLGEPELREICSGLVGYLEPEQILSQYVCVLANMKPKNLRGKISNGMVLCVSSEDHTIIELLKPAEGSLVGERVMIEGCFGEPDVVLSTKTNKDPFVAVQPEFKCLNGNAYYKNLPFVTSKGPCSCETLLTGTIS